MSSQTASPVLLPQTEEKRLEQHSHLVRRLNRTNAIASALLWLVTAIVALIFLSIIVNLIWTGLPGIFADKFWGTTTSGIGSELFNTFYILILTELFLVPISLGGAIFLVEYTRQGRFVTVIHFAAETLAGVPSLVLGMF